MLTFAALQTPDEAETCARMMAASEPWLTLGRGYNALLAAIQNPARELYLAKNQNEIAGLILLNFQGAFTGYLQSICVAPAWRGRGVGRELMALAERKVFARTPNLFLCVSSFNTAAQKFYLHLGYTVVGELKDYLVAGYDEILMRKTLGPLVGYTPLGDGA